MKKYLYFILLFLICIPAIAGTIPSYTEKNPGESADLIVIYDNDDGSTKKVQLGNLPSSSGGGFTDGGTNVYTTTTTDNVAIGTTTPTTKLTVVGTTTSTAFVGDITGNVTGNVSGLSGTSTALAANGANASSGNAILGVDASGAAEGAFDVIVPTEIDTSSELTTIVTDETGSGSLVFGTSPTLTTPNIGTPSAGVATNLTGTASGLTAGTVTTNANLTGDVTSVGNATTLNPLYSGWTDGGTSITPTLTTDRVGVGTTFASAALEVVSTGSTIQPLMISSVPTGNGDYMIVTSDGRVGIGTTAPSGSFGVSSATFAGSPFFRRTTTATTGELTALRLSATTSSISMENQFGPSIRFLVTDGLSQTDAYMGGISVLSQGGVTNQSSMILSPAYGGTAQNLLVLNSPAGLDRGNVGIGTILPTARFHIFENNNASGSLVRITPNNDNSVGARIFEITSNYDVGIGTGLPDAVLKISSSSTEDMFKVDDADGGDLSPFIINQNGSVGVGTVTAISRLSVHGTGTSTGRTFSLQDSVGSALFEVKDNGTVGIGTLSPGRKLDVSGTLKATDYYSGDDSQGITSSCSTSITAITIKDGLITSITCP